MKNILCFLLMLLLFAPFAMQAQTTATFGTGTSHSSNGGQAGSPMSGGTVFSYTQNIYTAAELTAAGIPAGAVIISIDFSNGTGENVVMSNCRTYMAHRATTSFSGTSDYTPYAELTLVDSSNWVSTGLGWFTVNLSNPFVWDGVGNLLIAVSFGGASLTGQNCGFHYTTQSQSRHWRRGCRLNNGPVDAEYASFPEYTATSTPSGTAFTTQPSVSTSRPNLRITYIMSGCPAFSPIVANVTPSTAELNWINFNQSVSNWDLAYGEASTFDTLTASIVTSITDTFYTLTGLLPSTNYIAKLKPHCSDGDGPWSASRTFATAVTCPAPTNVAATAITSDGCTLTWLPGAYETSWDIYLPTGTEEPSTTTTPTASSNTNSYTVTSLTPMTEYTMYVRANCGVSDYSFWIPVSFHTACTAASIPLVETFDNSPGTTSTAVSTNNLPNCWDHHCGSYSSYAGYPIIYSNSAYAASGNNALRFYTYTGSTDYGDQYAILPAIDVTTYPLSGLQLTLDCRKNSTSYNAFTLIVGVMSAPDTLATFVPVDTIVQTSTTYSEFSVDFSNYTGTGSYIAIMAPRQTTSSYNTGYVDNIRVEQTPLCEHPTQVTVGNITSSSAMVDWTPGGFESSWEVIILANGQDFSNATVEPTSTHPYEIFNLTDNAPYTVYVRAVCPSGGNSGLSSPESFRTLPLCTSPRNLSVSQIAGTSALVSWDEALVGAIDYTVEYSEYGLNSWIPLVVSGNQVLLSNLIPETQYSVRVFTNCAVSSADTVNVNFTTRCMTGGLVQIGSGTTTSSYLPSYSGSVRSYSQQLYKREELGAAGTIDTISLELASANANANRSISVYLLHTAAEAIYSWIPTAGAQLVYSGTTHWHSGWNDIPLTTPFVYNGVDNLVMVVIDATGTTATSPYNSYRTHTAFAASARYTTGSTYNINTVPTAAGTVLGTRGNIKFHMDCDNTATCVAPNVALSDVTDESITVEWVPGYMESSWQLEYCAGNGNWISEGTVTQSPYTINNLNPGTLYSVRLRSDCGGTYSAWAGFNVSTECSSVTLPYSENFNNAPGSGSGNMVSCWTRNTNNTTTAYPYTNSSYSHSGGGYSVYFYGTSAYYSYIASPRIDDLAQMNNLRIIFWAYKTSASYEIEVGIMDDPEDYSSFESLGQYSPSANSQWEMFEVNTNHYMGNGHYVAFRIPAAITSYMYVDDVEIFEIPACDHVDSIRVVGTPTTTSADLAWTPRGTETQWNVVYGLLGTIADPSQGTPTVVYSPSISLTSLIPSFRYDVYVQADCGGDTSIWEHSTFATACGLIDQLPFVENFDTYTPGTTSVNVLPICWSRINTGTISAGCPTVYNNSTYVSSGVNGLYFNSTTASTAADQYAILPQLDITTLPLNTLRISFKARRYTTTVSYVNTIIVGVMTNPTDASTFTPIDTVTLTSTTVETHHVDFTNYTGTGSYIAFMVPKPDGSTFTYNYNYIDDVMLDVAPACATPTNLQVSGVTTNSANLSWTAGSSENEWEIVLVQGDAPITTGTPYSVYTNSEVLSSLTPGADYTVYLRAVCPQGGHSDYISVTFSTQCEDLQTLPFTCNFDNVTGATTTAISDNNLPICWGNHSGTYSSYSGYPIVYSNSTYSASGSNAMRFYTYTGTTDYGNQYAILPPIDVTLNPLNTLQLKMDVRKNSTSYTNFTLIVGVMTDPLDVNTFVPLDTIVQTEASYHTYTTYFRDYTGTGKYIAMYAPTHGMNGITYNTGYVDNIVVDLAPVCLPLANVRVSDISGASALVSWEESVAGTASSFILEYSEFNQSNWTTLSGITGTSQMLSGLTPFTRYEVRVKSDCGTDQSAWMTTDFTTRCLGSTDVPVGTGTSTSVYYPSYSLYKNTYSQQIFLASEMNGPGSITSVSIEMTAVAQQQRNFKIYMMHTSQNTSSTWIPASNAQLCYQNSQNLSIGWNTFEFNTPFDYNGTDNLVLIFVDENTSNTSGNTYRVHTVPSNTCHNWYSNTVVYGINSTPGGTSSSTTTYRNNVKFAICDSTVTCAAPNVHVTNIDLTSAEVIWAPGYTESTWNLEYKEASDTVWTSVTGVTGSSYSLTGLNPSTHYNVRMQSDCGGGDLSSWKTEDFYTSCGYISIPFTENFDAIPGASSTAVSVNNLPYCWNHLSGSYSSYAGYPIVYSSSSYASSGTNALRFYTYTGTTDYGDQYAILPAIDVNTNPLNGLQLTMDVRKNSTSYNEFTLIVGVMSNPADRSTFVPVDTIVETGTAYVEHIVYFNHYTDTGSYIVLMAPRQSTSSYNTGYVDNITVEVIPTCPKPASLTASSATTTSITLSWNDPASASSWNIEYGVGTFTPGTGVGTSVTATSNPFTVTGLTANTYYTFYVQSDCGGGDLSNFSSACSASTACDAITTLPFSENFDSYAGTTSTTASVNNLPNCWNYLNHGTSTSYSGYPIIYNNSSSAASGTNALRFYSYTTSGTYDDQLAILPPIDVTVIQMNTVQLSFDARSMNTSYPFHAVVGIMTDPANKSTFVPVDTILTQTATYANYEIPFTHYTGTGSYIAIMALMPTVNYTQGYVDNVVVEYIPTCPKPTHLTVSAPTTSSLTLSWTENGTATNWVVEYGPAGFAHGAGSTLQVQGTPSTTIAGLSASTTYDFYVKANCGAGDESTWSSVASGNTACGLITNMPYSDGFDTYGTGTTVYPLCWSKINTYTSADRPYVNSSHYAGVGSLYFYAGSSGTYNIAITPEFSSSIPVNGMTATFMYKGTYTSDRLIVGVMGSTTDASTFVPVDTVYVSSSSASTWVSKTVSFANYTGSGHYVAFKNEYTTQGGYGYIDNLEITLDSSITPSTCLAPSNVTASNIQQTSATITWTAGGTETAWNLQYKEASASNWSNDITVSGTPSHNLTGLTAGTQYQVRVQSVCSATESSSWSNVSAFTTQSIPVTPPTVTTQAADNISSSAAMLHGTIVPGNETITSRGFEWKATVGGSYAAVTATGNTMSHNLTNLTPNTGYTFRAFATTASGTTYGTAMTFTTQDVQQDTCPSPTNVTVTDITTNTAVVSWTQAAGTASSWDVLYKESAADSWYTLTVTSPTTTLAGLTANMSYDVQVIALCTNGLTSDPSAIVTFSTLIDGIDNYTLDNSVTVFPNPTTGLIQIENGEWRMENVEVYDAYGKLLNTMIVNDHTANLDLSGYAKGTYFVRVTTERGVVTKRVVKN